jgi:hypothetical protein
MAKVEPNQEGKSIVLRGAFNPKIFSPMWFVRHDLLPKEEAEAADNVIVTADISTFTAGWLHIRALQPEFFASAAESDRFEALRDIVLGAFQILEHTPVTSMGINSDLHFSTLSKPAQSAIIERFVNISSWSTVLPGEEFISLSTRGKRADGREGHCQVRLEPSRRIENGIFLAINDHFELYKSGDEATAARACDVLKNCWRDAITRVGAIVEHVVHT